MDSNVEYRGIHRFPGYAFGSDGSVWSCLRLKGRSRTITRFGRSWKRLRIHQTSYGYSFVSIAGTTLQVARLILECFADTRDRTFDPSYLDGDKTNCSISNLEWVPRAGGQRGFQPGHDNFVTEDGRKRIGEKLKARWAAGLMPKASEETRRKISEAGKRLRHSEEAKKRISAFNKALVASGEHNLQKLTPEQRSLSTSNKPKTLNISEATRKQRRESFSGANNPKWAGGVTPLTMRIRLCPKAKEWRKAVFHRDDWTCQRCGERGGLLEAHHVYPFCKIMQDLMSTYGGVPTMDQALAFDQFWEVSNGLTLCEACHNNEREFFGNQYEHRLLQPVQR